MWTGVSRLAIGVTLVGALAAVLYYLAHSQAVPPLGPQVSARFSPDLLYGFFMMTGQSLIEWRSANRESRSESGARQAYSV